MHGETSLVQHRRGTSAEHGGRSDQPPLGSALRSNSRPATASPSAVSNWSGDGDFVDNQTPGTVAKFFNQDGSVHWTSTAYQAGRAPWGPIWAVQPC
ncbi:hypothetical protein ACFWD7_55470 [Streptomyces mirabilis]|uniref:hypothetical protein n=1 Tax=Streptomyces mirabilis TaxID=68239 RepID=UPI0036A63913